MILLDILYFSNLHITSIRNNLIQVSPYLFTYLQCSDLSDSLINVLHTSFYRKVLSFNSINTNDVYTYQEITANELKEYSECLSIRVGSSTYSCYIPSTEGDNILDIQQEDIDNFNTALTYIEDDNISNQELTSYLNSLQMKTFLKVSVYTYAQLQRTNLCLTNTISELPELTTVDLITKHIMLYKLLQTLQSQYVSELP